MTTTTIFSGARFSMLPVLRLAKAWLTCAIYSIALTIGLLGATAAHAGTTYSWVGTVDGLWSNANNWYPVGVPVAGDLLAFPAGVTNRAMTNDVPEGTVFGAIAFNGDGYTLGGNRIGLTGGISGSYWNEVNLALTLTGNQNLDYNRYTGAIDVGANTVTIRGHVSGAVSMGAGSLTLESVNLLGSLSMNAGTLTTRYSAAINGPIDGTGAMVVDGYLNLSGTHSFSGTISPPTSACAYCVSYVTSFGASMPNAAMTATRFTGFGSFAGLTTDWQLMLQDPSSGAAVILNTGDVTLANENYFEIQGPGAGVGYDQINATGTVTVRGNLNVNLSPTFSAVAGDVFTLVKNGSSTAVSGIFNGLPEGSTLTLGAYQFEVSYAAGVTLRCTYAPNAWTGAVNGKWSEVGNWTGGVPVSGGTLYFPQSATTKTMTNDVPEGTVFGAIAFNGDGYTLGGNRIGLTGGISGSYWNEVNLALTLTGNQNLDYNRYTGAIDVGANTVTIRGHVSGAVSMGAGSLTLESVNLLGSLSMNAGTLTTRYSAAINGPIDGTGAMVVDGYLNLSGTHSFSGTISPPTSACAYCVSYVTSFGASMPNAAMTATRFTGFGSFAGLTTDWQLMLQDPSSGAAVILNTGDVTLANENYFEIQGPGAGVGYDQINATGTVTVRGNLNVNLSPTFSAVAGDVFTLVKNGSSTAVSGIFNGLPEGSTLTLGAYQFEVSYAAGVTLRCTYAPNAWTGAVNGKWSEVGNWTGGVPVSGGTLYFPQSATTKTMTNDVPEGTVFGAIAFNGDGYTLGGNRIGLTGGISGSYWNEVNLALTLTGNQNLDYNRYTGAIDVGANTVTIRGHVSGAVSMGAGSLTLESVNLLGSLSMNAGTLTTRYSAAINGPIDGTGAMVVDGYLNLSGTHSFSGTISPPTSACAYCVSYVTSFGASMPNAAMTATRFTGFGSFAGLTTDWQLMLQDPSSGAAVILNTGDVTLANENYFEIQGPGAGVGYDQINATGTVTVRGNLNVSLSPSYVPTQGETYALISNDGTDAVVGTFNGVPEGHVLALNGVYQFRVSYQGGDGNNDVVLTSLNGKPPSTITLISSANPSNQGQSVTFTATLGGSFGTPTGSVTFRDGTTSLGTHVLVSGSAALTTSALSSGTHSITAEYAGDSTYGGGISPVLLQVVNKYASTTTMVSSANPSIAGNSVTFTATVTNGATGSVTFKDGATALATVALSGNTAVFSTSSLSVGTHSITAAYGGDAGYESSTSAALSQEVQSSATAPGAPTIGVATPGNGQVTIAFTPPASNGNSPITSYTVTCTPGPKSASGGSSPITVIGLTNGTAYSCSVTATNAIGTSNASGNVSVTPGIAPSITSGAPSGGTINVAYTHAYAATGSPAPTFSLASGSLPTGLSLSSNGTLAGMPSAVGTFSGVVAATNAIGSATQAFSITITATAPGAPTIGIATAANTQATITFTPPASNGGSPITSYAVTSSPGGITASGTASPITVTGLTNGTSYTFTVRATNATATSAPSAASNAVTPKSPAATSIGTITPEPSVTGQSYSVSVAVSATTGIASGSVVVKDDLGATCTIASLASAAGSCSLASTAAGVRTITATYAGAAAFLGSSATRSHTVNAANTKTDLASTPNPSTQGSPVTFTTTVSVSGSGKGTPTGTVTFTTGSGSKATTLGTATLNASGVATFTTSALPVGNNSVVAIYGGDANFNSSKGSVNQSVKKN